MKPEAALQAACIEYLRIKEKQGKLRFIAPMAEGSKSPKRAGWAKKMGLQAGVPDLVIIYPGTIDSGFYTQVAFVELKAKGGKLTAPQREWQAWCQNHNIEHHVIFSLDELVRIIP